VQFLAGIFVFKNAQKMSEMLETIPKVSTKNA